MINCCLLITLLISYSSEAQNPILGIFDGHTDIGDVSKTGIVDFNANSGEYKIGGSGHNMWENNDDFHFVWKKLTGDFMIKANFNFIGEGVNPHRKVGLMARSSLEANSPYADICVHGDGLTSLQYRTSIDGITDEKISKFTSANILYFEKKNSTYTMMVARDGEIYSDTVSLDLNLGNEVYVGLFICSHDNNVYEEAIFSNVRITIPADEEFVPYEDYIGSRLEIIDISSKLRKVLLNSKKPIESPNWFPLGNSLHYNSGGKLYESNLDSNYSQMVNTEFAININNDHVVSPDNKIIGISNHVEDVSDELSSIIFTLPINGGKPERITSTGPSYLHGWSPDGKDLIYTAMRGGNYDIYRISVKGGEEFRLTKAEGLDDGSEYSPDGKYIYFNSSRNGKMQLFRMNADGSEQIQITNDNYNNWFPHPSPDGKWIAFLTFPENIDPEDHPYYKNVFLRIMPADYSEITVLAYVYGGQGTINVPSWSPDSKKLAFISNTNLRGE
jgi:Tol biopolymer transport system component